MAIAGAVKIPVYSSLAAFIAHHRALKSLPSLSAEEQSLLAEMEKLIESIGADVRLAIESDAAGGQPADAKGRRRERAERRLCRELRGRGVLSG